MDRTLVAADAGEKQYYNSFQWDILRKLFVYENLRVKHPDYPIPFNLNPVPVNLIWDAADAVNSFLLSSSTDAEGGGFPYGRSRCLIGGT